MSAAPITLRLDSKALDELTDWLAKAPHDGEFALLKREKVADLIQDACAARKLLTLIDTPELVDFPRAVHLESVHQVQRWGTEDRTSKAPYDWFWLLSHLATRALEHHKEAERLQARHDDWMAEWSADEGLEDRRGKELADGVAHHREKAVHHTITAGAVLSHWHAEVLGKQTDMQPGHASSAALAAELAGEGGS